MSFLDLQTTEEKDAAVAGSFALAIIAFFAWRKFR